MRNTDPTNLDQAIAGDETVLDALGHSPLDDEIRLVTIEHLATLRRSKRTRVYHLAEYPYPGRAAVLAAHPNPYAAQNPTN